MKKLLIALLVCSLAGCTQLFFHPYQERFLTPSQVGLTYTEVTIKNNSGDSLYGWRLTTSEAPKALLLFLHGNAGNISTHLGTVAWIPKSGIEVVTMDYSGYGNSGGVVSVDQIHSDVEEMFITFAAEAQNRKIPFLVLGESLGATLSLTVSSQIASTLRPVCLVAIAPFSSYRSIAREKLATLWLTYPLQWPLGFLVTDEYSPITTAQQITSPVLFIHGRSDETVPYHHSERLCAAMEKMCVTLYAHGLGHDGTLIVPDNQKQVLDFFQSPKCHIKNLG